MCKEHLSVKFNGMHLYAQNQTELKATMRCHVGVVKVVAIMCVVLIAWFVSNDALADTYGISNDDFVLTLSSNYNYDETNDLWINIPQKTMLKIMESIATPVTQSDFQQYLEQAIVNFQKQYSDFSFEMISVLNTSTALGQMTSNDNIYGYWIPLFINSHIYDFMFFSMNVRNQNDKDEAIRLVNSIQVYNPTSTTTPTQIARFTPTPIPTPTKKPIARDRITTIDLNTYKYDVMEDGTISISEIEVYSRKNSDYKILDIPSEIDGHTVTEIKTRAIWSKYLYVVQSVSFPDTITSIPGNPFGSRVDSPSIRVSNSHPYLAVIDGSLFSKPDKRIIFHKPDKGYGDATSTIPNGIRIIGAYSFAYDDHFHKVIIPNSVVAIEQHAFDSCSKLDTIQFSSNLESIGDRAFYWCYKLTKITFPTSLKTIGYEAFSHSSLLSISLPKGLKSLGTCCFEKTSIDSLVIPDSVETIAGDLGVLSVTTVFNPYYSVQNGFLIEIGTMKLIQATKDSSDYAIPNGVKTIETDAFHSVKTRDTIHIPSTVESIDSYSFNGYNGKFKKIVIPSSVTSIEGYFTDYTELVVDSGSFAEEYAKEHKLNYSYSSPSLDWLFNE